MGFCLLYMKDLFDIRIGDMGKIGIINSIEGDKTFVDSLLKLLENYKADYTNTFAALSSNKKPNDNLFTSVANPRAAIPFDPCLNINEICSFIIS